MKDFQVTLGLWLTSFKQENFDLPKSAESLIVFLYSKIYFTLFPTQESSKRFTTMKRLRHVGDIFQRNSLYFHKHFFSPCCPRNKIHPSARRHLTTMMTANVIQTKTKEKKSQLWTIPTVKLKNLTNLN